MVYEPASLALSRRILRVLIALNWLAGLFILGLLLASLVAARPFLLAIGFPKDAIGWVVISGARLVMVIGVLSVPITNVVLTRLLTIVETVRQGDPFITDNARRLQMIAWAVVALELLHLAVGMVAKVVSTTVTPFDINWSFSFTRWIAVLLLFVLARVFEEGARMREELEGTI
jgi:hypothetical protein